MTMTVPGQDCSSFTVILPTYNEIDNITNMVEKLLSLYPGVKIIVSDDNSIDGTAEAVRDIMSIHPSVWLISRDPHDKGLTASLMDGIVNTETEHFIVMDADFQHPPASVGEVMDELSAGHTLVVGTRNDIKAMKTSRRLASWGANAMAKTYLLVHRRHRPRDLMSGFFGGDTSFWKEVVRTNGDRFERKGFKILFDLMKFSPRSVDVAEVRYEFGDRQGGESKLDSRVIVSLLRQCGLLGRLLAALCGPFLRCLPRKSPDQDAVATARP